MCLGVEGSALVSGGGLRQSVDGRVPARRRDASCHDFFCSRPPGLGYKGQSPGRVSRLRARSGGAAARCEGGREKKKVLLIKQALQARRPNPRAFTTTLYPDSLSRCEDVWRARRDFCGRLFDEPNLFFFFHPPAVFFAPPPPTYAPPQKKHKEKRKSRPTQIRQPVDQLTPPARIILIDGAVV